MSETAQKQIGYIMERYMDAPQNPTETEILMRQDIMILIGIVIGMSEFMQKKDAP